MSALRDAIAAMGKLRFDEEFQQFLGPANAWEAIDKSKLSALAWIEKALPYIGEIRDITEDTINMCNPEFMSEESLEAFKEKLENLDALLAEAKGGNHAEN